MKKVLVCLFLLVLMILPLAEAIIEEDWSKYIRVEEGQRDKTGNKITLSWTIRSYVNTEENYTIFAKDFDAQGIVILEINYRGRNETILLSGKWDGNHTKVILPEPIEAFDKTMIITPKKIVAPEGVFTCCPEVEININLIRPELFLEFDEDIDKKIEYKVVDPSANWSIFPDPDSPYKSPFDSSMVIETNTTKELHNSYRINEEIPMEIAITNFGDAESQATQLYIDTDGLLFENGKPYTELGTIVGKNQKDYTGIKNETIKIKLKSPNHPEKFNYTVHVYVKGEKNNNIYYYDDKKVINLLPSIGLLKSVTKDSLLISRKEVEEIYPSVDSDEISRWLQSKGIYVTLGITNYKNSEIKNITLYDTMHRQFTFENKSLNWNFDLKPLETKEFTYQIFTNRTGKFSLPSAFLTYSEFNLTWNLVSENPATEVHGPCIQVFKKSEKPVIIKGNNTNITITIRNSGDMPSRVRVNDSIPANSTLLEGQTYFEGSILPRESAEYSYKVIFDYEGQVELKNPILYVNGKESSPCGEAMTSMVIIQKYIAPKITKKVTPKPTVTVVEIKEPPLSVQYNWLEGVIPAFMLLLAIIVLFTLYRKNI